MPLSDEVKRLVQQYFNNCRDGTSSQVKKQALASLCLSLLQKTDELTLYNEFLTQVNNRDSAFSKAIDIKTGLGRLSSAPSHTRTEMEALARKLSLIIERTERLKGNVAVHLLKDSKGHGYGKTLPGQGAKNTISKAYTITSTPPKVEYRFNADNLDFDAVLIHSNSALTQIQIRSALTEQENARFISKGDLFNIYNKAGLDYKGQANYANLTLLKGGGLDIKVNLIGLFFPPAAALGFSGSVKVSANLLRGSQMFVYSEVVNGNNGGWKLPTEEDIKKELSAHVADELNKLDGDFFNKKRIQEGLGQVLSANDLESPINIVGYLANIQFEHHPMLQDILGLDGPPPGEKALYTTEDRQGGAYAGDLCQAIERAITKTDIQLSKAPDVGDNYNAIVVAGCMRSVAWEWMGKLGLEVSWSPLNVSALNNVTQYLTSSSNSKAKAAQWVAVGVSCTLAAEASAGRTNRSFIATDRNARIFAKGGGDHYASSHENLSSYISNCVRYSTDESLMEYIDDYFRSTYRSVSEYKKLSFSELLEKTRNKIRQATELMQNSQDEQYRARMNAHLENLVFIKGLLRDRINQKSDDPVSRFILAYSGTTWEFAVKADAKIGMKVTVGQKQGLWDGAPKSGTSNSGAKGLELIASLINHARAYRTSRYTLQVPLIKTTNIHGLPGDFNEALATGRGTVMLKTLWDGLDPNQSIVPNCIKYKTQETNVSYRKIETKLFADLKLENNLIPLHGNPGGSKTLVERSKDKQPKSNYSFLNTIEYQTAIAVWEPMPGGQRLRLEPGSGRCHGQAFVLTQLLELADASRKPVLNDETQQQLRILALALRVTEVQLKAFFASGDFMRAMPDTCLGNINPWAKENFAAQEGCVLIESVLARNSLGDLSLARKSVTIKNPVDHFNIAPESVLDCEALPDADPSKNLYTLQSIRLRYRMADLKEDKSTPFKLGLFLPGTIEVGIRVEEIENVGMSGIVDILTWWAQGKSSGTVMYNRDETVTATVLITQ